MCEMYKSFFYFVNFFPFFFFLIQYREKENWSFYTSIIQLLNRVNKTCTNRRPCSLFFALEKIVRVYIKFTDKNTSVRVTWGEKQSYLASIRLR